MLNTPHNPIGKAFTREEYLKIAQLVEEFNLLVISDEVVSPRSAACVPDAVLRPACSTKRLCSTTRSMSASPRFPECGTAPLQWVPLGVRLQLQLVCHAHRDPAEMFAATGWRVGWLIAPEWIISPTLAASTRIVFCSNSPMQEAVASGLEEAKKRRFFEIQLEEYQERRAILAEAFDRLGVRYTFPEGTYFMLLVSSQSPYYAGPFLTGVFRTCRILRGQKTTCSPSLCRAGVETSSAYLLHSHVCHLFIPYRACWFIATEIGVSSIPVSEVSICYPTGVLY